MCLPFRSVPSQEPLFVVIGVEETPAGADEGKEIMPELEVVSATEEVAYALMEESESVTDEVTSVLQAARPVRATTPSTNKVGVRIEVSEKEVFTLRLGATEV